MNTSEDSPTKKELVDTIVEAICAAPVLISDKLYRVETFGTQWIDTCIKFSVKEISTGKEKKFVMLVNDF